VLNGLAGARTARKSATAASRLHAR